MMQRTLSNLRRGEPTSIVVVGDSTSVVTPHTAGRMNWVGYLAEALFETYGDDASTLINTSRCGFTFAQLLPELERRVIRWNPDLVIFGLGMNDAAAGTDGLPAFSETVRTVAGEIRRALPSVEFLFRTPNPVVYGYWQPLPDGAEPGRPYECDARPVALYAEEIVRLAGELDCAVADHYTAWKNARIRYRHEAANPQGLRMRMSDTIHPNAVGHLALFRELAPLFGLPFHFPWEEVRSET